MKLIADYIHELETDGRYSFTLKKAIQDTGSNPVAVRASLRRLMQKGRIASPYKGFYVTVPPQYHRLGCLPPEQFIPALMRHRNLDYYVGLLSASSYYAAAHQRPQELQVVVPHAIKPLRCGSVKVSFIMKSQMHEMATVQRNTPRGTLQVSSPETTAFDLVGYSGRCGGLDNVIMVLSELHEQLDGEKLAQASLLHPRVWAQRLGFLLEYAGAKTSQTESLAREVDSSVRDYVKLVPSLNSNDCERNGRWKLLINATLVTIA